MVELAQLTRSIRGAASRVRRPAAKLRYMAFLSYSHRDAAIAEWLHEALEEFRVPPRLVGKLTEQGPVPKRLAPIFRDRQELAAAHDLGEEIEEAISGSRFLIVLCSPAAAKSRWIDKEIACFKRIHREDRILAAVVDGVPFASDEPGREAEECFPLSLRVHFDSRGRPTAQRSEPIAADLRDEADGRKMGLLKLVAGMVGVRLDDLVQRETQRRHRRLYIITAASLAGMLFTSGLAYTAIEARDAARDQRREAEGLIGFMLGDLRAKLEPIGRLDALDAVGARALAYYEKQDKTDLSDGALAQRSKALTLMGEIAESRGDLDGALRRYREALAGTAEALRRKPDDPQRLYDHAQNVYWVGSIAMQRHQTAEAERQFREYQQLAARMIAAQPENPRWQLERVYAATNLGQVQLAERQYDRAAETFRASVGATEQLGSSEPANVEYQKLLLEALAWLSTAEDRSGALDLAISHREHQLQLLAPFLAQGRPDADFRQKAMIAHMALSRHLFERGDTAKALSHGRAAIEIGRQLTELEPSNADWMGRSASTQLSYGTILLRAGKTEEAGIAIRSGCDLVSRILARDRSVAAWREHDRRCLMLRADLALAGSGEESLFLAREALSAAQAESGGDAVDRKFAIGSAHKLVGDVLWRKGDRNGAAAAWKAAIAAWPRDVAETPREAMERAEILRGIGVRDEASLIQSRLAAKGYRQSLSNRTRI
jgi:eukaryotic-like serine/threonine-protein kinase